MTLFFPHSVELNQTLTFTNSAWARNGNFLSALPLKPLLFLEMKRETKHQPLAVSVLTGTRCYDSSNGDAVIMVLLHYGRLYSQSDVPQVQAVFGHLALCKAHRLQLKYGKQLLPGVDDLALHISHIWEILLNNSLIEQKLF